MLTSVILSVTAVVTFMFGYVIYNGVKDYRSQQKTLSVELEKVFRVMCLSIEELSYLYSYENLRAIENITNEELETLKERMIGSTIGYIDKHVENNYRLINQIGNENKKNFYAKISKWKALMAKNINQWFTAWQIGGHRNDLRKMGMFKYSNF